MTFLKDADICEKLGISVMTLWRLRQANKLPAPMKLNGKNRTPVDAFEHAIETTLFDHAGGAA